MNGLQQLEKLRREKWIGYFACGNAVGLGPENDAFCTIWGIPTSVMLVTINAPTVEQAIERALAKLDGPETTIITRMPG